MGKGQRLKDDREQKKRVIRSQLCTREGKEILQEIMVKTVYDLVDNETAAILFVLDKAFGFRLPRLIKFIHVYEEVTTDLKKHYEAMGDIIKDSEVPWYATKYLEAQYHMTMKEMIQKAAETEMERVAIE